MRFVIYAALLLALVLPFAVVVAAARQAPRPAAYLLAAGSLVSGVGWVAGLGLLALATVGRLGLVGLVGHWSVQVLATRDPVPVGVGLASLAVLGLVALAFGASVGRLARGAAQVRRLHAAIGSSRCGDLSVIDQARPEALALPGWPGSVVVSSGMLRVLGPAERQVLLAHERCHLRSAHWAFRVATRLGAALVPTAHPLVDSCDQALERWADEAAAEVVGDRALVATAVARAALAATDHRRSALAPAFSEGAVTQRVEALLAPPPASRWTSTLAPSGLAVTVAVLMVTAARDLEGLFELARHLWHG